VNELEDKKGQENIDSYKPDQAITRIDIVSKIINTYFGSQEVNK